MFRLKVQYLIEDYGVQQQFIIDLIGSNRNTFKKKLSGEIEFTDEEKRILKSKYKFLDIL